MSELIVGYARVDITPKESVPLGGMGNGHARMPRSSLISGKKPMTGRRLT